MASGISYATVQQNSIKYMLKYVHEFEAVRNKTHKEYKIVREFFTAKGICFQNFYKFYNRYIASGRDASVLLPGRRGPKPKYIEMPLMDTSLDAKILSYRSQGHNKYIISAALKKEFGSKAKCSASTVYRILRKYGVSKLTTKLIEEKRKIVRDKAGSLAHIDCHYLPRGVVTSEPQKRYFVIGAIDDFSRIAWVEVMSSTKALDATFAMMDCIMLLNERYNIKFEEALTDNGTEFCGKKSLEKHPFERLLMHFAIKHRRTKPYRPQTNGKIERFWRTFHGDVIDGAVFKTLDELKDAVVGYNFYYNEHRPHQGINGKIPLSMLEGVKCE